MGSNTGKVLKEALRTNRSDDAWADELRELREDMGPLTDPRHGHPQYDDLIDSERGDDWLDRVIGDAR